MISFLPFLSLMISILYHFIINDIEYIVAIANFETKKIDFAYLSFNIFLY